MWGLEWAALALGVFNGAVLAIRPITRLHTRLDVLEARLAQLEAATTRIEDYILSKPD